ncbi:unnamed protein product [Mytilus coruscus]|uniref:Reverse transcriptase/retrotransposon-derived protein RNase H-like domain-containing protein n=1 Tax=Mytilus coruscus TaxID=42192 RepID=A0A6J8BI35_MYTCO|nr:unnamed protein product [Mytilus coruscus]
MNVCCDNVDIAALIDTGSSINIMSAALYKSFPRHVKSDISRFTEPIKLANGQLIFVEGTSSVTIKTNQGLHEVKVYILSTTSHPLILGKGLLLAKALVTVSIDKTIPLKLMNPTNTTISVSKGSILANFQILNADFSVITEDIKCPPVVQNVQISGLNNQIISTGKNNEFTDETKTVFLSNFSIPEPTTQLTDCLYENKDIFVTKENPDLGFSTYVLHKINLNPDVKPKHQQPCRLPPHKREVLRHHVDELLKQGIIAPISEEENVPITSHSISKEGVSPPPDRVQAIQEYPPPKNVKELRRLIGMLNWFRKFIPNFSAKISPLTRLLKKGQFFVWNVEQQSSFNDLKYALLNSKILAFPNYDLTFRLAVDTSSRGIGYMLYQMHPNVNGEEQPRVIRFGSKSLSRWQQSYGPTKLELLGMVVIILDSADYLRGNKFVVECDHQALRPIFSKTIQGCNL